MNSRILRCRFDFFFLKKYFENPSENPTVHTFSKTVHTFWPKSGRSGLCEKHSHSARIEVLRMQLCVFFAPFITKISMPILDFRWDFRKFQGNYEIPEQCYRKKRPKWCSVAFWPAWCEMKVNFLAMLQRWDLNSFWASLTRAGKKIFFSRSCNTWAIRL